MNEIKNSRVLVTGGAGLIGSHIVDACLAEGAKEVVVIDSLLRGRERNLEKAKKSGKLVLHKIDIRDAEALNKAFKGIDYCFHEAAIRITLCEKDPRLCNEIMNDGTFNVYDACIKNNVKKIVIASSASVYGESSYLPMDEMHPYNNLTAYGACKIANEYMLRALADMNSSLKFNILRYFSVYGPRMDVEGVYTEVMVRFIEKIKNGERPVIYGDGKQTIDMAYVEDVARANIMALTSDVSGEAFNVALAKETSIKQLLEYIQENAGTSLEPIYKEHPGKTHVKRRQASIEKIKKVLGWEPSIMPKDGLKRLAEWMDDIDEV